MAEEIHYVSPIGTSAPMEDFTSGRDNTPGSRPAPTQTAAAKVAATVSDPAPPPNPEALQAAVERINGHLASVNRVLELHVDATTGLTVATIKNAQTGEVLQQMPAEDSIHLAQMLFGWSHGGNVLLDLIA
ncbi:MAG TPA: flagellar protein FlaG [Steroidobacteraceae bacterium]|jgi:uncharacterized FlaG/YvyC family protein